MVTMPPVFAPVDHPDDFDQAFGIVLRERADALLVSHGPVLFVNIPRIVAFAAERGLPAAYPWREATEAGGLMSYGSSAQGLFRQAAGYVDRILKGFKPAELPVEQPAKFELVINLKTAKALG
jgi:putative ABC transport system substrate-binding protein